MVLAALSPAQGMETYGVQGRVDAQPQGVKGMVVAEGDALLDLRDPDPADPADRAGEIFTDQVLSQSDGLENTGGLVGLNGGNPHLGRDLDHAAQKGRIVILDRCVIILVQNSQVDQFPYALMGQVGTDGPGAEAQKGRHLVDIPGLAALQDQGDGCAPLGQDQVLLHAGNRQQGRDGHMIFIHAAVGQDDDIAAGSRRPVHADVELVQSPGQGSIFVIQKRNLLGLETRLIQVADL